MHKQDALRQNDNVSASPLNLEKVWKKLQEGGRRQALSLTLKDGGHLSSRDDKEKNVFRKVSWHSQAAAESAWPFPTA